MTDIEKLESILEMRGRTLPIIKRVTDYIKNPPMKCYHLEVVSCDNFGKGSILKVRVSHPIEFQYIAVNSDDTYIGIYKYLVDAQHFLIGDLKYAAVLGGKSTEPKPREYDAVLGGRR